MIVFFVLSLRVKRLMSCQARDERLCAVARAGCSQTRTRVSDFHPQTLTLLPVPMLTKSRSRRMVSQTTEPVWDLRRYIDSEKNDYRTDLTVSHKGLLCARSGFHLRYFLTSRPHSLPRPCSRSVWCLSYDAHFCQLNALTDSSLFFVLFWGCLRLVPGAEWRCGRSAKIGIL